MRLIHFLQSAVLKVLQHFFYPPFSFGGDAMGIQRLSQALVRRGHAVTIILDTDETAARESAQAIRDNNGLTGGAANDSN